MKNYKDISVVVQGAVHPEWTPLVLKSVRKNLPGACLILSTWKGTDTSGLDYDVLILNKDPGANICSDGSSFNLNRQIYSTIQGLKKVKTKYAIKIRSTCVINDNGFLKWFDKFNDYLPQYKIFKKRILIPSHYTVLGDGEDQYSDTATNYLYEISDWFFFGLTEDLINLFDIPLAPQKHTYALLNSMSNHELLLSKRNKPGAQYLDQQYIFVQSLLKNKKEIYFKDWTDISFDSLISSRLFIINNFVVLDYKKELNIEDLKYKNILRIETVSVFKKWFKLYRKFCLRNRFAVNGILFVFASSYFKKLKYVVKNYIREKRVFFKTKIKSQDISVVVQGAVNADYIYNTLRSIRKFLPNAEIVLSTWEGTNISDLDYDILVLNKDPGAEIFTPDGKRQNQNRQILSSRNGIKKTTRKYVLKIRSDMEIKGTKFLSYFKKYNKRHQECRILKERILINSLYTRNSIWEKGNGVQQPYLFHPSDWMMFGLREDILNVWNIPLAPEPQTSQYFAAHPDLPHANGCLTRWHAEQYIWLAFLKKNGVKLNYDNYWVYNQYFKDLSELSIVNNTTLLEYKKEFDILCQKYTYQFGNSETMHPIDWLKLYRKFCDPSIKITAWYEFINKIINSKYRIKITSKFKKFILPLKELLTFKWFFAFISVCKYIMIYLYEIICDFIIFIFSVTFGKNND